MEHFVTHLQLQTNKARLFCDYEYSYLGHDRNTPEGSEMLENLYLEYIEEIGMSWSPLKLNIYHFEPQNFGGHLKQLAKNPDSFPSAVAK